ncbi:MAG: DUF1850 domain-containing protein [Phascolarctobacterium sp.]|nr:DUF1850 domain-containing protein [Phascolarctobacterium sp.]
MCILKDRKPTFAGFRSFLTGLVIIAVILTVFGWYATRMIVSFNPENNKPAQYFVTAVGDVWNIRFTHSVERTLVEEFFTVNGIDDLVMTHTIFETFGWGLPYDAAPGTIKHTDDGKFDLLMNRPYKTVKLRVAVQARPCVVHHDDIYDLCEMYGQGTAVEIKVQYRYQYWLANYF